MLKIYYSYIKKEKSHELLKYVTQKYHGYPAVIEECVFTENGKPYLKDKKYFFNISHTEGMVMIAVSDKEVGIDVEKMQGKDRSSVINKCTTEKERSRIKCEGDFLCLWTKKESYIKYFGGNVLTDVNKITFEEIKPVWQGEESPLNTTTCRLDEYIYSVTSEYEDFDLILVM